MDGCPSRRPHRVLITLAQSALALAQGLEPGKPFGNRLADERPVNLPFKQSDLFPDGHAQSPGFPIETGTLRGVTSILPAIHQSNRNEKEIARQIYLMMLSRHPTERELDIVAEYSRSDVVEGREGLQDVVWALVNSGEFLHRH